MMYVYCAVCLSGFQCDVKRCIPADWKCDGHVDCEDQTDELNCHECARGTVICYTIDLCRLLDK